MKKELILILVLGIFLISAKSVAPEKSALIGSWKCVANDVPPEYTNSTIIITEKDTKLTGTVKFESIGEISLNYVKQTGKDIVMSLYVEGSEIIIKGKLEGSTITGTADTPDGQVSLKATKIEKKK
ncbi:MAG TPA: hypothetical protein VMV47_13200 [Bacteroidales bacterium]|nr:hypothetical protein [Bacteroidales bacterium]